MLTEELKRLKSGTDVRGVAVGDRSPITLTDEAVNLIKGAIEIGADKPAEHKIAYAYVDKNGTTLY